MKKLLIFAILATLSFITFAMPVFALDVGSNFISNDIALGNQDPRGMVAKIINILLGFLAVIALIIIILGVVMGATGGEDKAATAKKVMIAGVIGLIIILSAWGIARFVLENLINATQ